MSSTLTLLSAQVTRRLGRPTTDALLDSASITGAINDAAHMVSVEYAWPWLEVSENIATTTGTDTYAIPTVATTYLDTISLRISGSPPLVRMSKAELDRQFPSTASGTPIAFARLGTNLVVRPIPITTVLPTLVHAYHRDETALSAGSDVLLIPIAFEAAVVELAASELLSRASDVARAKVCADAYERWRNRMMEYARRSQANSDGNNLMPAQPQMPLPGKGAPAGQQAAAPV